MFETVTKQHGTSIKPGETCTFEFPYKDITIVNLSASCGCTDVANRGGKVYASYHANPIPPQLKKLKQDSYTAQKYVYVDYYVTDPKKVEKVTLTIIAIVEDKA